MIVPGSGASTLAAEFLLKDLEKGGRAAVLLTTRRTWELLRIAKAYGQDLNGGLKEGKVRIIEIGNPFAPSDVNESLIEFFTVVDEFKPARVCVDVIDPLLVTLGRRGLMSGLIGPLIELSRRNKLLTLIRCASARTYSLLSQFSTGAFRLEWSPVTRGGGSFRRLILDNLRDIPHPRTSTEFELVPKVGVRAVRSGGLPDRVERVSSGLPELDSALGGGYPRGSMILVMGGPGSGKTLLALKSSLSLSGAGMRALFISFAESSDDVLRRARSLGERVQGFNAVGADPSESSVAGHIQELGRSLAEHEPEVVVVDALELMVSMLDRWEDGLKYLITLRGMGEGVWWACDSLVRRGPAGDAGEPHVRCPPQAGDRGPRGSPRQDPEGPEVLVRGWVGEEDTPPGRRPGSAWATFIHGLAGGLTCLGTGSSESSAEWGRRPRPTSCPL